MCPRTGFFPNDRGEAVIFFDVAFEATQAQRVLAFMQQGFFLDEFTDIVTLQAYSYNAALKVFALSSVRLHFRPAGSIEARTRIDALDLELYGDMAGGQRMALELIFVFFVRAIRVVSCWVSFPVLSPGLSFRSCGVWDVECLPLSHLHPRAPVCTPCPQYVRSVLSVLPVGPHRSRRLRHWEGRWWRISGVLEICNMGLTAAEIVVWVVMVAQYTERFTTMEQCATRCITTPNDRLHRIVLGSALNSPHFRSVFSAPRIPTRYSVYENIDADSDFLKLANGGANLQSFTERLEVMTRLVALNSAYTIIHAANIVLFFARVVERAVRTRKRQRRAATAGADHMPAAGDKTFARDCLALVAAPPRRRLLPPNAAIWGFGLGAGVKTRIAV